MKLPRDISGLELIRSLKILGYKETRQVGSHIRLTTQMNGEHHITVPDHDPLKIGTLSAIIGDIAVHFNMSKEELVSRIWK